MGLCAGDWGWLSVNTLVVKCYEECSLCIVLHLYSPTMYFTKKETVKNVLFLCINRVFTVMNTNNSLLCFDPDYECKDSSTGALTKFKRCEN